MKIFLSAWVLFVCFFVSCRSGKQKVTTNLQSKLDTYIDSYNNAGDFSGTILICRHDSVIYTKSIGFANYELKVPHTDSTKFRIASITKSLTAGCIILLKQRGLLDFTDKVSKFIQDFPKADKITIDMLLRHTSGLPYFDYSIVEKKEMNIDELLASIKNKPFLFEPGKGSEYSNEGYTLLAKIIAIVSGESYESFLQKNIFDVLSMTASVTENASLINNNKAAGYVTGPGELGLVNAPLYEISSTIGSGSVLSTVPDLYKWCQAIQQKKLFDIFSLPYPYGWGRREYFGHKLIEQSGMLAGYSSYISVYPTDDLMILFLSNVSSNFTNKACKDIPAILFGEKYEQATIKKAVALKTGDIEKYQGQYFIDSMKVTFSITQTKGNLYLTWLGAEEKQYLVPISDNILYNKQDGGSVIVFSRDQHGTIVDIRFGQEGDAKLHCTKIRHD